MSYRIQTNVLSVIDGMINNNKISHAFLFEVDNSDDAMEFIKKVAKLILCNKDSKNFNDLNCEQCNICNLIDNDNYPDFNVISTDGNWIKKQQLMDLQADFNNKSLLDNKRIYVIKDAEKLNVSSSNSLLKFLEEPGDDVIAILVTKNRYLLLDTILSRCQIFCLKDQEFIIDSETFEKVVNFVEYLATKKNLFVYYKDIYENILVDKNVSKKILSEVEKYFISYLIQDDKGNNTNVNYDLLSLISVDEMVMYVKIIEKEIQKLEYNVNYKIWLDSFFSRIIGEVYD